MSANVLATLSDILVFHKERLAVLEQFNSPYTQVHEWINELYHLIALTEQALQEEIIQLAVD